MKAVIATPTAIACYHCGEDCPDDHFKKAEKKFCCQGCLMVYDLLEENELCQYYDIGDKGVIGIRNSKSVDYVWLEQAAIVEQLLDYYDESLCKVSFYLPQIHCSACLWLLEKLYKFNPGISKSKINFLKKEIYISYNPRQLSLKEVVELLASLGYPPQLNLNDLSRSEKSKVSNRLVFQLGIAGFVFGNTMLLSFPEYLGLDSFLDHHFRNFFGYLNLFLSIPLVLYCGQDYLYSAYQALSRKQLNIDIPISLGIITLFLRSSYEILTHTGAGYLDSLAGLIFFLLIGRWFQQKTYHQLSFERDFKSYFPIATQLISGEARAISELKRGDQILIRNGELIPADGILQRGTAHVDYSFVTGESAPLRKNIGDKLFAGGRQEGETIEVLVQKPVKQSYLTQLWNDTAFQKEKSKTSLLHSDELGKYFTIAVLLIAFATLSYWLPKDIDIAVNAFTAVLIIACPCAIALTIPFTLGNALRLLSRNKLYVKSISVLQDFQKITAIVFDKTGTLTTSREQSAIHFHGNELSPGQQKMICSLAAQSNHPISRQIVNYFGRSSFLAVSDFSEKLGKGIEGVVNEGFVKIGKAEYVDSSLTGQSGTFVQIAGVTVGHFLLSNIYRKGTKELLTNLGNQYQVYLLSGDNDTERKYLGQYFDDSHIHFGQSPHDKLAFIQKLQKQGEKVMMIGDGLNDAGALKQSNIGLVVSEDTNNFTPASDAILAADQLPSLLSYIKYLLTCKRIVIAAYVLAIIYNLIGLSFAVRGLLSPVIAAILMPLSSITIVVFGVMGSWIFYQLQKLNSKSN